MTPSIATSLSLLSPRDRRRGLVVVVLVLIRGLAETAGVASIIPFLTVLSDPSVLEGQNSLAQAFEMFGRGDAGRFLAILGSLVLVVMLVSAVLRTVAVYAINKFANYIGFILSTRLLSVSLRRPYVHFLNHHSGDAISSILGESNRVVQLVFRPLAELVNHSITFSLITIFLLFSDPLVTLTAALLLGGSYVVIFLLVRPVIRSIGLRIVEANKARYRFAQEVFAGIKQVKLGGREQGYVDRFSEPARVVAEGSATTATLQQVPRFGLELLAFGGIIVLTLVLLARFGGVEAGAFADVVPLLGLYAIAGYRLLPALQGIYQALAQSRLGAAPLDQIYNALEDSESLERLPERPPPPMGLHGKLELRDVTYTYPGAASPSLHGVSLSVNQGATVGIVGSTGAGKTTVTDIVLGLLRPQSGEVLVGGQVLDDANMRSWRASVGYVPQDIFLTDSTVSENIAFGIPPGEIDPAKVGKAARMAQLHDFVVGSLPQGYDTLVGESGVRLSGGQRQRIGIARALYHDPDLIVFDEATSALDNLTEREVMAEVGALSGTKTVILIAHRLSTVRKCDQIAVLEQGRLVALGTYDELVRDNDHFRNLAEAMSAG